MLNAIQTYKTYLNKSTSFFIYITPTKKSRRAIDPHLCTEKIFCHMSTSLQLELRPYTSLGISKYVSNSFTDTFAMCCMHQTLSHYFQN